MRKKIAIFDLDDTLIFSAAKIKIYDSETNELLQTLSPSQYNFYAQSHDHYMCFQDFECRKILGNSKINEKRMRSLRGYLKRGVEVAIVTARGNKKVVVDFFKEKRIDVKTANIYAVCDPKTDFHGSISERKKQAVDKLIKKGYNDMIFYDDNVENLKAVESLSNKMVSIKIIHVLDAEKEN
jgi:phosphoserine phosphatase